MEGAAEQDWDLVRALNLLRPFDGRPRDLDEIPEQKRVGDGVPQILLASGHDQWRSRYAGIKQAAETMAETSRGVKIDEGWPTRRLTHGLLATIVIVSRAPVSSAGPLRVVTTRIVFFAMLISPSQRSVETDADRLCPRVNRRPEPSLAARRTLTEAGCTKIFTEQMSGAVTDRRALHDALEFARSGDTLIVWKLDRLARSMKQLIETVETLRLRGIGFRSLTEALDTTTAQGRLVFHMFGALAEFERSLIRERTQAGLAAARRAGRTGGRPPKLTDDDIEAAKAMLANPDIGVTQIAHRLGVSPGYALSLYPRRANREYPRRLRNGGSTSQATDLG